MHHVNFTRHVDAETLHEHTAATRWLGERMDYDLGVWILCNQANRAREEQDVSAETCDQEDDDFAETFEEEDDVSAETSSA